MASLFRHIIIMFFCLTSLTCLTCQVSYAIDFSGNASTDFTNEFCFEDPNGQNIALPDSFGDAISGFDVDQLCLAYNGSDDILYVGIKTFDDTATGDPIPFGDADGDGDPGNTSAALAGEAGEDLPNLEDEEYFSFIIDFDNDLTSTPNAIAGISAELSAPNGFVVSEIATPDLGVNFSFLSLYYGEIISTSNTSALFANPSSSNPHLEFTITNFSSLPSFSDLDTQNPDETILIVFKAGSLADTVIGEEDIRITLNTSNFFDDDGDKLPNSIDWDQDNDGIPDITEQDFDEFDEDGSGQLSANEVEESDLDSEEDGDLDTNDEDIAYTNTDEDETSDYLDTDTDDDTILDIHEADTINFDENDNLSISPDELELIDINSNYAGGNNSGALHNDELPDTDEDDTPDYRDADSDEDSFSDAEEAGDDDPLTAPVDSTDDGIPDYRDPNFPEVQEELTQAQGSGFGGCSFVHDAANPSISSLSWLFLPLFILFTMLVASRQSPVGSGQLPATGTRRPGPISFLLLVFILLLNSAKSNAINTEQFRPNFDSLGLVNLLSSKTLQERAWSTGFGISYAANPIELGDESGARVESIVDYHLNMTLNGAYGIKDWVSVGIIIPFFPAMRLDPVGTDPENTTAAFGDFGFAGKFHLWDSQKENLTMGFGVSPYLFFPTGSTDKYTGNTNVTGGFSLLYDLLFWQDNLVLINLGLNLREKEDLANLSIGQELTYGLGFTRPIIKDIGLHALTEIKGSSALNGIGSRENRNPLEWLFGIKKGFLRDQMFASFGGSLGLTTGYGTPDFRIFSQLTYVALPLKKKQPLQPRVVEIEKRVSYKSYVRLEGGQIVILEPIHFETAKWIIKQESLPVVQAVSSLMIEQPHIRHVVVKGHTDHRGKDAYNLTLSQNRAQAVVDKLVEYGVERERLTAEGWGERQPIDSNITPEGMYKNRRVEFHIVEIQKIKESEKTETSQEIITKKRNPRLHR